MNNILEITFEGDHVQVIAEGDKDFAFSVKLWAGAPNMCKKHQCFKILGVANTSKPLEAVERYDHARLFGDLGIDHHYRIEWVEKSEDAQDIAAFIEAVLSNRGLPGRLFATELEAREWLLAENGN